MGLFGSDKNSHEKAKEKVNELSANLRKEGRQLDRQINGKQNDLLLNKINVFQIDLFEAIEREEQKTTLMIKTAAKKNDMDVCRILAKSLVQ